VEEIYCRIEASTIHHRTTMKFSVSDLSDIIRERRTIQPKDQTRWNDA